MLCCAWLLSSLKKEGKEGKQANEEREGQKDLKDLLDQQHPGGPRGGENSFEEAGKPGRDGEQEAANPTTLSLILHRSSRLWLGAEKSFSSHPPNSPRQAAPCFAKFRRTKAMLWRNRHNCEQGSPKHSNMVKRMGDWEKTRRPKHRLGLLCLLLPKLTRRADFSPPASVPDAHISTKPVASSLSPTWMTPSTTTSPYISPTETMATMTTSNTVPTAPTTVPATARNSVDSNALPVYPEFSHLRISSKQQLPSVGSNTSNRSQQDNTSWVTNKKVPFFTSPPSAPPMTQANHLTPWEKLADNRSPSPSHPPSMASRPQSTLLPLSAASSSYDRLRCASAQPLDGAGSWMHGISADQEVNRAVSNPIDTSRLYPPQQESSCLSPQTDSSASGTTEKRKSRMSWLPGGRSRSNSVNQPRTTTGAWLLTPESREQSDGQQQQKSVIEYSPAPLVKGEKVREDKLLCFWIRFSLSSAS